MVRLNRRKINLNSVFEFAADKPNFDLIDILKANAANQYNPTYVKTGNEIYTPAFDWNLDAWSSLSSASYGDVFFKESTSEILRMNSTVKGQWANDDYTDGDYVYAGGIWSQVISNATPSDVAYNPENVDLFDTNTPYEAGMPALTDDGSEHKQVIIASSIMQGAFSNSQDYTAGQVVQESGIFYQVDAANWSVTGYDSNATYAAGDIVRYGNDFWQNTSGGVLNGDAPGSGNWTNLGASMAGIAGAAGAGNAVVADVTALVTADASNTGATTGTYFSVSPFQAYANDGSTTHIGDPTINNGSTGVIDDTARYADVTDAKYWAETHYSSLDGITVNTSYEYGDNIFYQGKNYIYVSHLSSDNPRYLSGADPTSGYTEFEQLLDKGAVVELPMYVDTVGGGGSSNLADGVHYKPKQDLTFVDRLSDGRVRTAGAERRTDAPMPPGDGIFNSADDQFFGGLASGNDGIYGTADDYYTATVDPNIALGGGHVDSDADNNKELLDTNNDLGDFSVADFVDFIQTLANVRAVNGGTMSRLNYAERILEENEINLGAAASRIMDTDMAYESTKMARQNVLLQAAASMVTQANSLNAVVLSLLQ